MWFPLTVAVTLNGQPVGSILEIAVIETIEPFTFPLNVPLLVSVPHVPDNSDPDCVIVKNRTWNAYVAFVDQVPATQAVEGAVGGPAQPTSSETMMSAIRRRIAILLCLLLRGCSRSQPVWGTTHPWLCAWGARHEVGVTRADRVTLFCESTSWSDVDDRA
jgi:hypothetical protein